METQDDARPPTLRRVLFTLLFAAIVPPWILTALWSRYASEHPFVVEPGSILHRGFPVEMGESSDPCNSRCIDAAVLKRAVVAKAKRKFRQFADLIESWNEDTVAVEIAQDTGRIVAVGVSVRSYGERRVFSWKEWALVPVSHIDRRIKAKQREVDSALAEFVENVVRDEIVRMWRTCNQRKHGSLHR